MTAKILSFEPTMFTLQRKIQRECRKDEREAMVRAAWMLQFEPGQEGCQTEADWEAFLNGDYEL